MKGGSAELALDGRLILKNETQVSEAEIVRELMERGMRVTDECVDEVSVTEQWEAMPTLDSYVAPPGLIPPQPDYDEVKAVEAVGAFLRHFSKPTLDQLIIPDTVPDELVEERNEAEWQAEELLQEEVLALAAMVEPAVEVAEDIGTPEDPEDDESEGEVAPEETADTNPETAPRFDAAPVVVAVQQEADSPPPPIEDDTQQQPVVEPSPTPAAVLDPVATLKGAKELLDIGVIDDDEYAQIRAAQLAAMGVAA